MDVDVSVGLDGPLLRKIVSSDEPEDHRWYYSYYSECDDPDCDAATTLSIVSGDVIETLPFDCAQMMNRDR